MVELYKKSNMERYLDIALVAGSFYLLAAAPHIIGMVSEKYNTNLENKVEYVDYSK